MRRDLHLEFVPAGPEVLTKVLPAGHALSCCHELEAQRQHPLCLLEKSS